MASKSRMGQSSNYLSQWIFWVCLLFEDVKQRTRTIDSVALRITYPLDDTRAFQPFDCAAVLS
jgi:hypothetical protein